MCNKPLSGSSEEIYLLVVYVSYLLGSHVMMHV